MITRENYEKYIADYWDNQLVPGKKQEFEAFLLVNPDIEERLEETKAAILPVPQVTYPHKQALKHLPEGEYSHEFPRIKADKAIVFEKKNLLYRKPAYKLTFFRYSAAALILLLISIGLLLRKQTEEPAIRTEPANTIVENVPAPVKITPREEKTLKAIVPSPLKKQGQERPLPEERQEVMKLIPSQTMATVTNQETKNAPSQELQQVAQAPEMEIVLNEKARDWKSSADNFQSKNIFTSALSASRSLAEKIKTNE